MALINKPYTFSAGATIVAAEHNSNFDTVYNEFNGSISNANISAMASITDSKLAQITTSGKVSGAAITLLTSVPSGAGILPIANIASGTPDGTLFVRDDGSLQSPVTAATQAQMESASSTTVSSTPGRQQYHPGHPKAWVSFDGTGTTILAGYNVASITHSSTGLWTVTFTTSFSSTTYCVVASALSTGTSALVMYVKSKSTGSCVVSCRQSDSQALTDSADVNVACFGDL